MSNTQIDGGAVKAATVTGNGVALGLGRVSVAMSDANYTALAAQFQCRHIELTGALTAGRNYVVPLTDGAEWVVFNNTTGGFAVTIIGATGTGIAIAAGKTAIVRCDGTNVLRVTADNP